MWRRPSAQSLKSDYSAENPADSDDEGESIFAAAPPSSGHTSDQEKESSTDDPDSHEQGEQEGIVSESTSLLHQPRRVRTYDGITVKGKAEIWVNGQSAPNVVYASPAKPHLPSPSASNSRLPVVAGSTTGISLV